MLASQAREWLEARAIWKSREDLPQGHANHAGIGCWLLVRGVFAQSRKLRQQLLEVPTHAIIRHHAGKCGIKELSILHFRNFYMNQEVDNARQCDNNSTSEVNDFFYQKI